MIKGQAWVKKNKKSAGLLAHEQLHLWIAQKAASIGENRIRSGGGVGFGSSQRIALAMARKEWESFYNKIRSRVRSVATSVNLRYDSAAESDHNRNAERQIAWQNNFERWVEDAW